MANSSKNGGVQLLVTELVLGTASAVVPSIDALTALSDLSVVAVEIGMPNVGKVPPRGGPPQPLLIAGQ